MTEAKPTLAERLREWIRGATFPTADPQQNLLAEAADAIEAAEKALDDCASLFVVADSQGIHWEALAGEFNRRQKIAKTAIAKLRGTESKHD